MHFFFGESKVCGQRLFLDDMMGLKIEEKNKKM